MEADNTNENFNHKSYVPNIVLVLLCVELIVIVALIVLYSSNGSDSNLLYISYVIYLFFWSCYFSWQSLVKENGFELSSFMLFTALVSGEGISFLRLNSVPSEVRVLGILYFLFMYLTLLAACYYCYMFFAKDYMQDFSKPRHLYLLKIIKEHEVFISANKVFFASSTLIIGTFIFYVNVIWTEAFIPGLIFAIFTWVLIVVKISIGTWAVSNENESMLKAYFYLMFFIQIPIVLMAIAILRGRRGKVSLIISRQCGVIFGIQVIYFFSLLYLGRRNKSAFNQGRKVILKETSERLRSNSIQLI